MGYKDTPYAWRLASASFAGATVERLQLRDTLDIVIRFADWRGRSFNPKALEIGEDELLVMLGDAIAADVFSISFRVDLLEILRATLGVDNMVGKALTPAEREAAKKAAQKQADAEFPGEHATANIAGRKSDGTPAGSVTRVKVGKTIKKRP